MPSYHRALLLLSWQQLIWQTGEFSIVIPEAALCKMWIYSESSEWAKTKLKSTISSWCKPSGRSLNSQNGVKLDFSAILTSFPLPFPLDDFIERQNYLAVACYFIFYFVRRKTESPSAFYFVNRQFSLHSSSSPSLRIPHSSLHFSSVFLGLWEPFDVDVHGAAYAHFYFYATRGMGSEGMGAGVMQGGVFGMCVFSFGGCRGWKWVGMQTEIVTPLFLSLLSSLSFPGGLYGWKWGVLSAASFAQTVPSSFS